jgi:hypothetical protein
LESGFKLLIDLVFKTSLFLLKYSSKSLVALFEVLGHFLSVAPLVPDDILAHLNCVFGRLQALCQVLYHLVFVLRLGHLFKLLKLLLKSVKIDVILVLSPFHFFFLMQSFLDCFVHDFVKFYVHSVIRYRSCLIILDNFSGRSVWVGHLGFFALLSKCPVLILVRINFYGIVSRVLRRAIDRRIYEIVDVGIFSGHYFI